MERVFYDISCFQGEIVCVEYESKEAFLHVGRETIRLALPIFAFESESSLKQIEQSEGPSRTDILPEIRKSIGSSLLDKAPPIIVDTNRYYMRSIEFALNNGSKEELLKGIKKRIEITLKKANVEARDIIMCWQLEPAILEGSGVTWAQLFIIAGILEDKKVFNEN